MHMGNIHICLNILGPSKKKAKHNAALAVLGKMLGINNGQAVVEDYSGFV